MLSKYKFDLTSEQWDSIYKFTSQEFQESENCERNLNPGGISLSWLKENPLVTYSELEPIKKLFTESIYHYFEQVHNLIIPSETEFEISDSWFVNVSDPGIKQPYVPTRVHNHPFSICSGIFYMDDSEHGTMIYSDLKKPHWPFMWEEGENLNSDLSTHLVKSEKGTLILFPAETKHSSTIVKGAAGS